MLDLREWTYGVVGLSQRLLILSDQVQLLLELFLNL